MNIITYCTESLMEAAAYSRLEQAQANSLFKKLKMSLIILLDNIFATLSSSYQDHRTLVIEKVTIEFANENDEATELNKAHNIFQRRMSSPSLIKEELEKDSLIHDDSTSPLEEDNVVDTVQSLIEQGLQEEEILDIMKDALAEDRCRELIAQIKEPSKEQAPPIPVKKVKNKNSELTYPAFILAIGGINQYQAGGPAACTPLACQFLASKQASSEQMLANLILANNYKNAEFIDTEESINQFHLNVAENPWETQRAFGPSMQVNFEADGEIGITSAVTSLLNSKNIGGAILIANGVTIAMRKQDHAIEFFDSHGDDTLTKQGNVAYIYAFANDQIKPMVDFLIHRFPNIGFTPSIEIWPIEFSSV